MAIPFGADRDERLPPEETDGLPYSVEELRISVHAVRGAPWNERGTPIDRRTLFGRAPYDPSKVDLAALPPCPRPKCRAATGQSCRTWEGAECWPHKTRLRAAGKVRPKLRKRYPKKGGS